MHITPLDNLAEKLPVEHQAGLPLLGTTAYHLSPARIAASRHTMIMA